MGFHALFNLVFVSVGLTTLQLVLAFHVITSKQGHVGLYSSVFCISMANLLVCIVVRKMTAIDGIPEDNIFTKRNPTKFCEGPIVEGSLYQKYLEVGSRVQGIVLVQCQQLQGDGEPTK